MSRFGCDAYGRYYERRDGERLALEPHPFKRQVAGRVIASVWIAAWYVLGGKRRCSCDTTSTNEAAGETPTSATPDR